MSVAFDAALVAALARELDGRLRNARLRAVQLDRAGRSLALLFRDGTLRFGLHPEAGTLTWHQPTDPAADDRPIAARLKQVRALPDDRVLRLAFLRVRGSPSGCDVTVEWITRRWNAVVTEGPEAVVRHVLVDLEGERAPRTGHPWTPPVPSGRAGVADEVTMERWRAALLPLPPEARRRALLAGFAWTSALNADALLGAAAERTGGPAAERALEDGYRLWMELAGVALGRREPAPVLLSRAGGMQPYPIPLPTVPGTAVPTLLDGFARAAAETRAATPLLPAGLVDTLRERIVRAWAKVESLCSELAEAPDPNGLRRIGDLILARLGEVARGTSGVPLTDFEGAPVTVEIDPRLAPHENASAYYERAARAERARERLPELIAAADAVARRLETLMEGALAGAVSAAVLRSELPAGAEEATRGESGPVLPYRAYRSSGGLEIRVGRGARHNDDLTFHYAAPDDVWMHARHAAGAHVVLRWRGEGNPPARDLTEAAMLAALHSRARTSGSVPVDWTRRKYVRKPRKAPAGQVLVERVKTVFVDPDPALEERLRES